MVALVWFCQSRELVGVRVPVEISTIDHCSAHLRRVAVHILRGAVRHDICAPLKRTAVNRRGERVVHDKRQSISVRQPCQPFYVEDVSAGIADGFAEDTLRIRTYGLLNLLVRRVGIYESTLDAQLLERHGKQIESAAVNRVRADKMIAGLTNIKNCVERCCLPAAGKHAAHAAFQRRHFASHRVIRRICQSRIEVSLVLQVKKTRHLVAGLISERRTLINGQLLRLALAWFPSSVNADCLQILLHLLVSKCVNSWFYVLFYSYRLCQISRLVDIKSLSNRHMIA